MIISGLIVSGIMAIAGTDKIEPVNKSSTINPSKLYLSQSPEPIPPRIPTPLPRELPETQPSPLQPNPNLVPSPNVSPSISESILVEEFEFLDNTVFTNEELAEVTQSLVGKSISFAQLLQVETIITELYTKAGYVNSGAYIASNQNFTQESAVVKIQIVEGGLEGVEVTGTDRLRANYILDRLPAARTTPLNQNKLLEDLQLLQLNPLIQSISAQLGDGSRPEAGTLEIDITEANSFSLDIFLDNGRSPSVGSLRRGATIQENNLLGFGDRLTLAYTNTDGSNSGDISYNFPLNRKNGSLNLAAGISDTEVVESPFDELDIQGDSYYLDFTLRQPIIFKPTQELALGITFSYQDSQTKFSGEDFFDSTISTIRFFQDFIQRNPTDLFALRSQLSVGLDLFNSTIDDNDADSRFVSWRGQAQYVKLLATDTVLILRSDLQFTDDSLLSQERFSVGGLNSVRGYRQNLLLADNGVFASAEIKLPLSRFAHNKAILQLTPFIDFGTVWNIEEDSELETDTVVSVGAGLELDFNNVLDAKIDWGIPLVDDNGESETLQEDGIHFFVEYKL